MDIWVEKCGDKDYRVMFGNAKTGEAVKSYDYDNFEDAVVRCFREIAMQED